MTFNDVTINQAKEILTQDEIKKIEEEMDGLRPRFEGDAVRSVLQICPTCLSWRVYDAYDHNHDWWSNNGGECYNCHQS